MLRHLSHSKRAYTKLQLQITRDKSFVLRYCLQTPGLGMLVHLLWVNVYDAVDQCLHLRIALLVLNEY